MINLLETVSAFILGLAFLVLYINIIWSTRRGEKAHADPWDGRSLEWSVASPPPAYNFAQIPIVRARDSFWVQKYGRAGSRGVAMFMAGQVPRSRKERLRPPSRCICRRRRFFRS